MSKNLIELFLREKAGKQIIDSLPIAVYATDTEGRLKYYNSAAVQFSRQKPELHAKYWDVNCKLFYPDGTPMPFGESPMAVSLKEERSLDGVEAMWERPNGDHVCFRVYTSPLYNEDEELIGGINMLVDITGQKETEKQLMHSEKELSDFFENAAVGLHQTGSDGIIKRANQTILDMLGYSREEFVGKHISDFHADQEVFADITQKVSAGEELQDYEIRLLCKDGSIRHVLLNSNGYLKDGEFHQTRCITRDITERKQAEEALRKNEEKYRTLVENFPNGAVGLFDKDLRYTAVGGQLVNRFGVAPEDRVGSKITDLYPDDLLSQIIPYFRSALKGESNSFEAELHNRHLYAHTLPVENERGEVIAGMIVVQDVTERWEAQRALRKSEEKYRTLFETMEEGFCIIKMEFNENDEPVSFRYLEINPAYRRHTGLKDIDIEGKRAEEVLPKVGEDILKRNARIALTGEPFSDEVYVEEVDRWLDLSAFRVGDPEERKVAVLFGDITERKKVQERREQLLRQIELEQERLIDIFKHAPSAMCFMRGPDHIVERANKLFMQLVGNREVIGRPVREAIPEAKEQGFTAILDKVYTTGEPFIGREVEINLKRQEDSEVAEKRYLDYVFQPVFEADGSISGVFVQGIDITERKRAKEELKAMNETLEQRVEERTKALLSYQNQLRSLASQLSRAEEIQRQQLANELHDNLGQMLALGKMKVNELGKDQLSEGVRPDIDDLKKLMDAAITYTQELTSDLKPPPSVDNDLNASINWVAEKMAEHGLDVTIDDDGQPKPLEKEMRIAVIQSVKELLFNVIKHTSENKASVELKCSEELLHITVKDEGEGFDSEDEELRSVKEGRFGLFNLLERIDLLGGQVDIETSPGDGTKITLHVPLSEDHNAEDVKARDLIREQKAEHVPAKYEDKIKVLLVDDHKMFRNGLRKIIEDEDDITVVGEAGNGKEAITLSRKTYPDVILMDVSMPEMDGIEATAKIITDMPGVRIIGVSLHDSQEVMQDMRNAGASAYMTKTEAFESLVVTIRAESSASKDKT